MNENNLCFWLTVIGTVCWAVCFAWMYRITAKQDRVMEQLREQGQRIERFSKVEHDLIKEVHPQVGEIKDGMNEVMAVVKDNAEKPAATAKKQKKQTGSR